LTFFFLLSQKILRESDHWNELFALLGKRKVRLYLTGSEMSGKDGVFKKDEGRGDQQEQQAEGQEEKTSVRKDCQPMSVHSSVAQLVRKIRTDVSCV